jgi:hypothetical protein
MRCPKLDSDLLLVPLLLPILVIGLLPLALLGLVGYFGFVVLGLIIGQCTIMAEMEDEGDYAWRRTTAPGGVPHAERAGHRMEMRSLRRTLVPAKILSAGLIILGFGGFLFAT